MTTCHHPGRVVPRPRPRVTAHGTYMPATYRRWRAGAVAALSACRAETFDGPVAVDLTIVLASVRDRGGPQCRPDLDNLVGAVFDACTMAGVWLDDSQVIDADVRKRRGKPGFLLRVWAVEVPEEVDLVELAIRGAGVARLRGGALPGVQPRRETCGVWTTFYRRVAERAAGRRCGWMGDENH